MAKNLLKIWEVVVEYGPEACVKIEYKTRNRKEALEKINRDRVLPSKIVYFKIKKII